MCMQHWNWDGVKQKLCQMNLEFPTQCILEDGRYSVHK